jgi:hypothetical protein
MNNTTIVNTAYFKPQYKMFLVCNNIEDQIRFLIENNIIEGNKTRAIVAPLETKFKNNRNRIG